MTSLTLGELAVRLGCALRGNPDAVVDRVAPLGAAGPGGLSFLASPQYRPELRATRATAVVLAATDAALCPVAALIARNPHAVFARGTGWYLAQFGEGIRVLQPPTLRARLRRIGEEIVARNGG